MPQLKEHIRLYNWSSLNTKRMLDKVQYFHKNG